MCRFRRHLSQWMNVMDLKIVLGMVAKHNIIIIMASSSNNLNLTHLQGIKEEVISNSKGILEELTEIHVVLIDTNHMEIPSNSHRTSSSSKTKVILIMDNRILIMVDISNKGGNRLSIEVVTAAVEIEGVIIAEDVAELEEEATVDRVVLRRLDIILIKVVRMIK